MSKYNKMIEENIIQENVQDENAIEISSSRNDKFELIKRELNRMFEPDNIRDGISQNILHKRGGVVGLSKGLEIDLRYGLDFTNKQDIAERENVFGKNNPVVLLPKTVWELIIGQFEDQTLKILLAAAFVSLVIGMIQNPATGWMEGFAIFFAIFIILTVTATNDYLKEKQFAKLNSKIEEREVNVLRNGKTQRISVHSLIVGDVFIIKTGEILPVEGILFSGSGRILIDESSATGESELIVKVPASLSQPVSPRRHDELPFLISGSKVMEGTGKILICTVGENTQVGKMKLKLQEDKPPTSLQMKLETVANDIGKLGIVVAILTVIVLLFYLFYDCVSLKKPIISLHTAEQLVNFLMIGITIVVMAVPEGLPLAVTISLAYSLGKMKDENNLVKQLASCEIMGGANNICSDKTGTLTENIMHVATLYIQEEEKIPNKHTFETAIRSSTLQLFCEGICINSDATPERKNDKMEFIGNKTECALLQLTDKLGFNYESYRPSQNIIKVIDLINNY